jgi:1-aminocyclopropane-1-carboxylate deaminase
LADGLKKIAESSSQANQKNQPIIRGFLAIKGGEALSVKLLEKVGGGHCINTESHLGGFGKCPESLINLIQEYDQQGLHLDPVYTAKMIMAFEQGWQAGLLDQSKRYLLIHTGGLQGRRGVSALSASLP